MAFRLEKIVYVFFKIILLISCTSFISNSESSQPQVYSAEKFKVLKETDITYAQGLSHDVLNSENSKVLDLKLDVYHPDNDAKNRPLYFFIHGGGFKEGSKSGKNFVDLANYFASRGWVFVSIDYRLKKDYGTTPKVWSDFTQTASLNTKIKNLNAIYPAVRDAKAALRWVVKNADKYRIDKEHISVGGGSAGAMMALAVSMTKPGDFASELSLQEDTTLATIHSDVDYEVKTIISHWGSNLALDIFEEVFKKNRDLKNRPPIFIAHGKYDKIVNIKKAEQIVENYKNSGVPYVFYPIEKEGHGLWKVKINDQSLEELAFNFMVKQQNLIVK